MPSIPIEYDKLPITYLKISDIMEKLDVPLLGGKVTDVFTSPTIDGSFTDSEYCPGTGELILSPFARQLNNLQSIPYMIGKFRNYGYRWLREINFLILQTTDYYHVEGVNIYALYPLGGGGFPYWPYNDRGYGTYYPIKNRLQAYEKLAITIPPNRLVNIGYNLKPNIYYLNSVNNQSLKIITTTGTILFEKTSTLSNPVNGSDIYLVGFVKRESNGVGGEEFVFGYNLNLDTLYSDGDMEMADDYSFFYHNVSSSPVKLYIIFNNYSNELIAYDSVFIRPTINQDINGNLFNCSIGNYYTYPRSHVFLYDDIFVSTSYTLNMSGGNTLTSPVTDVDGLQFKIGYHINGVHQGYLSLTKVGTGLTSTTFNHIGNLNENYTFTTTSVVDGLYLEVAASQKYQNSGNIFNSSEYVRCSYTFIINETNSGDPN